MGDPKKSRRKYESPKRPYEKARIQSERELRKKYGLRRNKEIRKAESILRNIRRRSREMIANQDEKEEKVLLDKTYKMGLIEKNASLDDLLNLEIEHILQRRLQTQVFENKFANTVSQARQFISHRHIFVGDQKVTSPSFLVKREDEKNMKLNPEIKKALKEKKVIPKKVEEKKEKPKAEKVKEEKINVTEESKGKEVKKDEGSKEEKTKENKK